MKNKLHPMIATIINAIAVIIGALIGVIIGKKLPDNFQKTIMTSAGLTTLVMGISMALKTSSYLILLFSLIIGGLAGTAIGIEDKIKHFGEWINKKTVGSDNSGQFAKGFLAASILFCAGSMSILGPIQAGTDANYQLLYIKSVLDFSMAIVFGATYGIGTMFAFIVVLVYQGFFTFFGHIIAPWMGDAGLNELACTGGILLIMIALDLLNLRKSKAGNFILSMFIAPLLLKLVALF